MLELSMLLKLLALIFVGFALGCWYASEVSEKVTQRLKRENEELRSHRAIIRH